MDSFVVLVSPPCAVAGSISQTCMYRFLYTQVTRHISIEVRANSSSITFARRTRRRRRQHARSGAEVAWAGIIAAPSGVNIPIDFFYFAIYIYIYICIYIYIYIYIYIRIYIMRALFALETGMVLYRAQSGGAGVPCADSPG